MFSLRFPAFPSLSDIYYLGENFRKFPPNVKFPENLQPYSGYSPVQPSLPDSGDITRNTRINFWLYHRIFIF